MSYAIEAEPLEAALPKSLEAENVVIGSLLLDPRRIDEVSLKLRPEQLHGPAQRMIYSAMLEINNARKLVDVTLVIEQLRKAGQLERCGGVAGVVAIADSMPLAENALSYSEIVARFAEKREAIGINNEALRLLHDPSTNADDVIESTVEKLLGIVEKRSTVNHITASQVAATALDGLQSRMERRGNLEGVGFALYDVARLIGRMRPQDFVVLAARTSGGKSALGNGIIEHAAGTQRIPTLLVTLEMSGVEVLDRLISTRSGVAGERIRDGILSDGERKLIVEHASDFEEWPLLIDDTPLRTMADITAQARMLKRQGRLEFLVIDHIGCIEREHARQTDYEHMSKVSRRLKVLARELNIVVLGLCQINRQSEQRGDPRPKLSDIKATGSIEQDANIVMFVHRPELYAPDDEDLKGKAELYVLKNRGGRTGVVPLRWNGDTTSFQSVSRDWSLDE